MAELVYDKTGRLLFTKEMKREYQILMPQMLPIHFELIKNVMRLNGYNVTLLKGTDSESIRRQGLEKALGKKQGRKAFLPQDGDAPSQEEIHRQDKQEDTAGVPKGGGEDVSLLAAAVFAQVVDALFGGGTSPPGVRIMDAPT